MEERQNAFQRAEARNATREDSVTKWHRNDAARAKRAADTTERDARIERNARQRASWAGNARAGGIRTASGVALDPVTVRLKSAAEIDRQPKPPSPPEPSDATVYALALQWMADNPNFYRSPHNGANFKNFMCHQVSIGRFTWSYEGFSAAHDWLEANGYFEKPPAPKRREFAMTSAPKTYLPYLSGPERAAEDDRQRIEQARRVEREVERALSMDFATLRREVRGALPQYGREEVR